MTPDDLLEAVAVLNPGALARARRLASAVRLIRSGHSPRDATRIVVATHSCSRIEAWRVVAMAVDMAGPIGRPVEARCVT